MDEMTKARLTKERFEMLKEKAYEVCSTLRPYEWYDDGCPYDRSGNVRKMTLEEFTEISYYENPLEEIYTNVSVATFMSGYGLRWMTFGEYIKKEVEDEFNNKYMDKFYDFDKGEYYSDEHEIAEIEVEGNSEEMFDSFIIKNKDTYIQLIKNNILENADE